MAVVVEVIDKTVVVQIASDDASQAGYATVEQLNSGVAEAEANTTAAVFSHEQQDLHVLPQHPIIGPGADQAVAGNDVRLADKRVSPDNSVTAAQLTGAAQALFDAAGSAAAVNSLVTALTTNTQRVFQAVGPVSATGTAAPWQIIEANMTASAFSYGLPASAGLPVGTTVAFKIMTITGTNYLTVVANGSDTINGTVSSVQLKLADELISFVWTGSSWLIGPGHKSLSALQALFAPIDSVPTAYQSYISAVVVTNSSLAALAIESGYVWAIVDQSGHVAWGIKADGTVAGKISVSGVTAAQLAGDVIARLPLGNVGSEIQQMPDEQSSYLFAIVDANGQIAFAVKADGTITANTTIADGSVTYPKLSSDVQGYLATALGVESGFAWAVVDQSGHAGLTVGVDGTVSGKIIVPDGSVSLTKLTTSLQTFIPQNLAQESGYLFCITDNKNQIAFAIDLAGNLVGGALSTLDHTSTPVENPLYLVQPYVDGNGKYQLRSHRRSDSQVFNLTSGSANSFDPRITEDNDVIYRTDLGGTVKPMYMAANGGQSYPLVPSLVDGIACWGDSLTQGAGGNGTTYGGVMGALLGCTTFNYGIGGQTSPQIAARQGGQPDLLTVTANQIPASGSVNVTALAVRLLSTAASTAANSLTGTLAGVPGTLLKDTSDNYTFTRTTSGSVVACPPNTPFIPDYGVTHNVHCQVLWLGRNNLSATSQVESDIAASVAYLKTYVKRVIVIGVESGSGEPSGSSGYTSIVALNAALASIYGNDFIDIRRYMIDHGLTDAGISPTTQDTTDLSNDVVPSSLRADAIHLTAQGYTLVGTQVANKITSLGWS